MITSTTTPVYIAYDGRQFLDAAVCKSYETGLLRDKLRKFLRTQTTADWTEERTHDAAVDTVVDIILHHQADFNRILDEHAINTYPN